MRTNCHSIRHTMISNIALMLLLFMIVFVSDRIILVNQNRQVAVLITNNHHIDALNTSLDQYKLSFNTFQLTGSTTEYEKLLNHSKNISHLLAEMHPVFENHRNLLLFSRIVDQINESQLDLVMKYMQGNKNAPEAFELSKEILNAFTVLTDAWNTLINHYLQANHESWISTLDASNKHKQTQMLIFIVASMAIFIFVGIFTNDLLKRLRSITKAAEALSQQKWETENLTLSRYQEFKTLSEAFNNMKAQILKDLRQLEENLKNEQLLHEQTVQIKKQQLVLQQSRYEVLQAQINPHFLFNTLNMIIRTIQTGESIKAISLIRSTSNLLRNSLELGSKPIPLSKEITLLKEYLSIMEERNRGRIDFSLNLFGGDLQVLIPSFSLQSLVENAIKHGLADSSRGGKVQIDIFSDEDEGTFISVSDNGKGALQSFFDSIKTNSSGHGLSNIINRLSMLYTNTDVLKFRSDIQKGCTIILHLNKESENAEIVNR